MKRIAIFVEGHGELIFVREFLLKWFEWERVTINCFELQGRNFYPTEYPYEVSNPLFIFRIYNTEGDGQVVTEMTRKSNELFNNGYTKIVGLRDMFGAKYKKELAKKGKTQQIDSELNRKIISELQNYCVDFQEQYQLPENFMQMCFSIMELEAWILSFPDLQARIDARLTNEFIDKSLNINLLEIDAEITFFHPKEKLKAIWGLIGKDYGKHQKEMNEIMGKLAKKDFETLLESGKCNSFKHFFTSLNIMNR